LPIPHISGILKILLLSRPCDPTIRGADGGFLPVTGFCDQRCVSDWPVVVLQCAHGAGTASVLRCVCLDALDMIAAMQIQHIVPERVAVAAVPEGVAVAVVPERVAVAAVPEGVAVAGVPEGVAVAAVPERVAVAVVPERVAVAAVPEGVAEAGVPEGVHPVVHPQPVSGDVVPAFGRKLRRKHAVGLPHAAPQAEDVIRALHHGNQWFRLQLDVVLPARHLGKPVEAGVNVGALIGVVVVEGVIPIGPEGAEILRVRFRKLNCAQDIRAYSEVVVSHRAVYAFVLVKVRVDVAPGAHIRLQGRKELIHSAVSVRLRTGVIGQLTVSGWRIVPLRVRHLQRIAQEADVLEVVSHPVVELVLHPEDDALSVGVGPGVSGLVVVKAVFQLPRPDGAVGEIRVPLVQSRPCVLVQMALVVCGHNHVKGVAFRHPRVV